jgi:hypothetical protein
MASTVAKNARDPESDSLDQVWTRSAAHLHEALRLLKMAQRRLAACRIRCSPLDPRARWAAGHLGLPLPSDAPDPRALAGLEAMAADAGLDVRDAEAALIRLALAHARRGRTCPGGMACLALRS